MTVSIDIDPATLRDLLATVNREVALRTRKYPEFVRAGKLDRARADEELANMTALQALLREVHRALAHRDQPELLPTGARHAGTQTDPVPCHLR